MTSTLQIKSKMREIDMKGGTWKKRTKNCKRNTSKRRGLDSSNLSIHAMTVTLEFRKSWLMRRLPFKKLKRTKRLLTRRSTPRRKTTQLLWKPRRQKPLKRIRSKKLRKKRRGK